MHKLKRFVNGSAAFTLCETRTADGQKRSPSRNVGYLYILTISESNVNKYYVFAHIASALGISE